MTQSFGVQPNSIPYHNGQLSKAKLIDVAHQFEASLMRELMKPFDDVAVGVDGEPVEESGSSTAITSFASDAVAKAISDQGGFGISKMILHYFETNSKT